MRIRVMRMGMLAGSLIAATSASTANAGLIQFGVFETVSQVETGPATFSPSTYAYDGQLTFSTLGEFTTATVVGASTGPLYTLSPSDPTTLSSGSVSVATQADLSQALPPDTYTIFASGGTAGQSVLTITQFPSNVSFFPQSTAGFTASTFSMLQGVDASQGLTLGLLPFVPASNVTDSLLSVNIYDASTQQLVYSQDSLPSTTTSLSLAAGTLAAGTTYTFGLDYSDRISQAAGDGQIFVRAFDNQTSGIFTTAALATPEPATLTMLGFGAAVLLVRMRRQGEKPCGGDRDLRESPANA